MTASISAIFFLPRNVVVAILRIYRFAVSPFYGNVCRFFPSCSAYALRAIQEYGVCRGVFFAIRRVTRCHPWSAGGVDDVPTRSKKTYSISRFGFVIPNAQRKA